MTAVLVVLAAACAVLLVVLVMRLEAHFAALGRAQEDAGRVFREELSRNRQEAAQAAAALTDALLKRLDAFAGQLSSLTQSNEQRLERMRETVESRLRQLQSENAEQLERMRATVDEKLHATLETRLGEAFKTVSERLEQVHQGLGEMRELAIGVGDLKKVLSNVKTSGIWGEIQLGSILEQILVPEQYGRNVRTKAKGGENVEYAIKLPGRDDGEGPVWLPVDSKFPKEYYEKLLAAQESGDPARVEAAAKELESRIKQEARAIKDKYLDPPGTTDFGILFLPVEGLYAEVLRRPGLCDFLQREHRVVVAGPTTFAALLNSLQMGFRTLAIEKRSSEVWRVLGAVKTEFGRFGEILESTHKKLQEASNKIQQASVRSRAIERKLNVVQGLPSGDARRLMGEMEKAAAEGGDEPPPSEPEGIPPD